MSDYLHRAKNTKQKKQMNKKRNLAIIGVGPRGGYALECLIIELAKQNKLHNIRVFLFEETKYVGYGPVYALDQKETNWININLRILHLEERPPINIGQGTIPAFPSFHDWSDYNPKTTSKTDIDQYPPRSLVGNYLSERFQSLYGPLDIADLVCLIKEKVVNIDAEGDKYALKTPSNLYDDFDEILLTIGHQSTKYSKQLKEWKAHTNSNAQIQLFTNPYPISQFVENTQLNQNCTIGLRGFGLAMIDVVRGIASEFGDFVVENEFSRKVKYESSYKLSNILVPFSLDGLPPAPKPINAKMDEWFLPSKDQILLFEKTIANKEGQRKAQGVDFIIDAMVPIIAERYCSIPTAILREELTTSKVEDLCRSWLNDEDFNHQTIVSHQVSTLQMMRDFVGMALGKTPISLDYCIGQVWRHCQPSMYDKLSHSKLSDEVLANIIKLDERIKRYSYGPPVESIQQLIALNEANILCLDVINNPKIETTEKGWRLSKENKSKTVDWMINTVLDAPKLEIVDSAIVENLTSSDLIQAVHNDMGVATNEFGYIVSAKNDKILPIALLGRLAKGTIIGVDAILECFGDRPKEWAGEAAKVHSDWVEGFMVKT